MSLAPLPRLVSFLVPTLREDELPSTLVTVGEALADLRGWDFEVLVVDDSPEPYKRRLDEALAPFNARFGPRVRGTRVDGPQRGKGAAIQTGVFAARGEIVFWMDADMPVPLNNIGRFLRVFEDDPTADFIVAERPFERGLAEPVRFVASRVLYVLQRFFVFQEHAFDDTQCGFKAFRRGLARQIAQQQIVSGGMADIEYLYAALRIGARPVRIAVNANPEMRASKVNVERAVLEGPIDLLRVKLHGASGGYRRLGAIGATQRRLSARP